MMTNAMLVEVQWPISSREKRFKYGIKINGIKGSRLSKCPYCGKELDSQQIMQNNSDRMDIDVNDNGYYCSNCKKRII